jgi:hypothetical protein
MLNPRLHQQAVDDNFNGVVFALVEIEVVLKIDQFAVDACAGVAVLEQRLHLFLEFAFASADDGREHHNAVFRRKGHHPLHDLLGRLAANGASAFGTVRNPDRGEQKAKIVVNFGDRPHGGTWTAAGGFLLNRNRRAQAINGVHIGTLHLVEKLAGVGRKRLHVTALTLGVNRVEC